MGNSGSMDKVRVVLPSSYDLVVGDTFQLFYRGIIEAVNPYAYDILALCEKGHNYPRYFEYTPAEVGEHKLTVTVYANDKSVLATGETILRVCEGKKSPNKEINILCMGDSLTSNGVWAQEAYRRLTATDGAPCGLGLSGFRFIGNMKNGEVGYEGYGGWTWETFMSPGYYQLLPVWIECKHNKTEADQHSIWQDGEGNLWQLETIEEGRLKFNRKMNRNPKPDAGARLFHLENAKNTECITVEASHYDAKNPFWNNENDCVDFVDYCRRQGVSSIDAVYILLTWNGQTADRPPVEAYCQDVVRQGKAFVDILHRQYPQAQIKIMGLQIPSVHGGTGANYGAKLPYCDDYDLTRFVLELNRAYEAWTKEEAYRDYMEFINISGQFDSENNMPYTFKPVNTRSNITEKIGTNGVHPLTEGYLQIGDAVYRNMVKSFCSRS